MNKSLFNIFVSSFSQLKHLILNIRSLKILNIFCLAFILSFLPQPLQANNLCLTGSVNNDHLITSFEHAKNKSEVTKSIIQKYQLYPTSTAANAGTTGYCSAGCTTPPQATAASVNTANVVVTNLTSPEAAADAAALPAVAPQPSSSEDTPKLLFNPICLQKIVQHKANQQQVKCNGNNRPLRSSRSNDCMTDDLLQYQNAVVTDFYQCLKAVAPENPITPEGLFKMYSQESQFKPNYNSKNGSGIGQVTGIFIKDIHQAHRGQKTVQLMKKNSAQCQNANLILNKNLNQSQNRCEFIKYGEGFERNVLYSMIGLNTQWNHISSQKNEIGKYLKKLSKVRIETPKIQEKLLLNSYGRGGFTATKAIVKIIKNKSETEALNTLNNKISRRKNRILNEYLLELDQRQNKLSNDLSPEIKITKEDSSACINQ